MVFTTNYNSTGCRPKFDREYYKLRLLLLLLLVEAVYRYFIICRVFFWAISNNFCQSSNLI